MSNHLQYNTVQSELLGLRFTAHSPAPPSTRVQNLQGQGMTKKVMAVRMRGRKLKTELSERQAIWRWEIHLWQVPRFPRKPSGSAWSVLNLLNPWEHSSETRVHTYHIHARFSGLSCLSLCSKYIKRGFLWWVPPTSIHLNVGFSMKYINHPAIGYGNPWKPEKIHGQPWPLSKEATQGQCLPASGRDSAWRRRHQASKAPPWCHGAMVKRNRSDIGAFVGFPYVMWVPLKIVGL